MGNGDLIDSDGTEGIPTTLSPRCRLLLTSCLKESIDTSFPFGNTPVEAVPLHHASQLAELRGKRLAEEDVVRVFKKIVVAGDMTHEAITDADRITDARELVNLTGRKARGRSRTAGMAGDGPRDSLVEGTRKHCGLPYRDDL
jgi:hypothetical protein